MRRSAGWNATVCLSTCICSMTILAKLGQRASAVSGSPRWDETGDRQAGCDSIPTGQHAIRRQPGRFDLATTVDLSEEGRPSVISAAASQRCSATIGQVSSNLPRGMAISAPSPSSTPIGRDKHPSRVLLPLAFIGCWSKNREGATIMTCCSAPLPRQWQEWLLLAFADPPLSKGKGF